MQSHTIPFDTTGICQAHLCLHFWQLSGEDAETVSVFEDARQIVLCCQECSTSRLPSQLPACVAHASYCI